MSGKYKKKREKDNNSSDQHTQIHPSFVVTSLYVCINLHLPVQNIAQCCIIIYLSKIYGDEHPVSYHHRVLFNLLLC